MTVEERVLRLENAFSLLVEMVRHHDEQLDDVRAEASNADGRIAAIADAQIRADERIAALADAQIETERALTRLSETVEKFIADGRGGKG